MSITYHSSCKLTVPLSIDALVLLSACFTKQDKWQYPELPRHEQHPLINGCPSSSSSSSWHIQQNGASVSMLSVLVVRSELVWPTDTRLTHVLLTALSTASGETFFVGILLPVLTVPIGEPKLARWVCLLCMQPIIKCDSQCIDELWLQ